MARLDTGWHANSKVLAVGLQAMGLHAWSISYCDDALSDGFIPMGAWPALPGAGAAVKALLTAGLWQRAEGGFWLHDYTDYNRTKAQVLALREGDRVRKMSGRNQPGISAESGGIPRAPGPGPRDAPAGASLPTPYPLPKPNGAPVEPAARRAVPTTPAEAITTMYGPPAEIERLPNGAQQCPLCPDIFTGTYSEHLDSARHKIRPEPDDLSNFHA